jgi:hypothetical protein
MRLAALLLLAGARVLAAEDVMTQPGSNGSVFIDSEYQDQGWPVKGFAKDNLWFEEDILVKGDTITVKVDGKLAAQWTQPADWAGTKNFAGGRISPGTIALQRHDPGSTVYYRNIRVKPLE